ncbi:MAG: LamG-like jellyroll fold domain-containing protein, partial [Limisphaerales bacterium]
MVANNLPQVPFTEFTAEIGLRMTSGSAFPADGVSVNFGPGITTNSLPDETGFDHYTNTNLLGLSICFDTYRYSESAGMAIRWNGTSVARTNISDIFSTNSVYFPDDFHDAVISLEPATGGMSTVTVTFQSVTLRAQVAYVPDTEQTWGMVIGARCGGVSSEQAIDHIELSGTWVQSVDTQELVGEPLSPYVGTQEITESTSLVFSAPDYVYLDRYHRELTPTDDNINSIAHYRARLDDPAATVSPSGMASYRIVKGSSVNLDRDTTVTLHWIVENLAEVDSGTSSAPDLSATDITDNAHVDTLGRRYLAPGTTGFDSLVNRSVTAAQQGNVRFGSRGYVMENAPNSPERYLELAGEGDHLRSSAAEPVLPGGATQYTIEFWARRNLTPLDEDQVVLGLGSFNGPGQRVMVGFGGNGGFFVSDGGTRVSALPGWTDEEWHHWAAVVRGTGDTNSVALYRDSVLLTQTDSVLAPFAGDNQVTIGARAMANYATAFFSGGVNNVRIWDHALDRPALYTALATSQFSNSAAGLLLEMPFDSTPTNQMTGVYVEHFTGPAGSTNLADDYTLQDTYTTSNFRPPTRPTGTNGNAWHYRSQVKLTVGGYYSFWLRSMGPSQLWVDGQMLIDYPGPFSAPRGKGTTLTPGHHLIEIQMFDTGEQPLLELTYYTPASPMAAIPDDRLFLVPRDLLALGRVTSSSTEGKGLAFVASGFENLFPANTPAATMLAAIQPGFRLGLTAVEGGQNTVQIDPIGKAPLNDWR